MDIRAYLETKGYYPRRVTGDEAQYSCFFHQEQGRTGRLYINVDPNGDGVYWCHVASCGAKGNYRTLRRHFGDPVEGGSDEGAERRMVLGVVSQYYEQTLGEHTEVIDYLEGRGLTRETILERRLGWADGLLLNHRTDLDLAALKAIGLVTAGGEFFRNCITIPYLTNSSGVATMRGKAIGGKYFTMSGDKARLYNSAVCFTDAKDILICEGEFDSMIASQLGFAAVGVPGANTFPENWKDYFSVAKHVYVVFDNDDPGRAGAEKVAGVVGKKARILDIGSATPDDPDPDDKNDLSDWVVKQGHTAEELHELCRVTSGGLLLTVDDAYLEWDEMQGVQGIEFGWAGIDASIKPGLLPGQVAVLLAKSGTGKTLWLLNVFQNMAKKNPDTKILFVSLEQTRSEWFTRAVRIAQFFDPKISRLQVLDYWRDKLMIVDKNRISEEELLEVVDEYADRMGAKPDLVAVDYLGYWARSYRGERYQQVSDAIMALKAIAKELRIAILVPHQVNRGANYGEEFEADAARDAGVVEETADFIFTLWDPDAKLETQKLARDKTGHLNLRVAKSRHGGAGKLVELARAPASLAIVDRRMSTYQRIQRELEWVGKGLNYESILQNHQDLADGGKV